MDFRYPSSACLFLSAILAASVAVAARIASPWTDIHAPSGAAIKVMGKSGKGTLIAGTSYGYLFRSTDGGQSWARTWEFRTNDTPKFIFASGDSLILASYASIPFPLADCWGNCTGPYRSVGLLASRDDGLTWNEPGLPGSVFAAGPGPNGSVLAAGRGIYIHPKGDTAWKSLAFGFSMPPRSTLYPFWTAMGSSGSTLIGIYDSLLYAAEYLPGKDSVTFRKVMDTAATALYSSESVLFASTAKGLFRFLLFQANSSPTFLSLLDTAKVSGLMEADSGYLIGMAGKRLRRGKARGGDWQDWGPVLPESASAAVWLNGNVLVGGDRYPQFLRSVSAGPWTGFGTGVSEFPTDPVLVTREAVFTSTSQGVLFALPGGAWSRVDSLAPEKNVSFMAQGTGTFWAAGKSLWRASGDPAHARWTVPRGLDPGMALLRFGSTGKHLLASGYANVGGFPMNFLAVCPLDGDSCRMTPPGALGVPKFVSIGIDNAVGGFAGTGDTLVAAVGTLLHRSKDGGLTWDTLSGMGPSRFLFLGKRLFSVGYHGVGCGRGNCWQYSDDVGKTWSSDIPGLPEISVIPDLQVHGGVLFAATAGSVYASRDGFAWKDLAWPGGGLRRLAAGDGILAAGTDDSRVLILETESVGLNQARSAAPRKGAMDRRWRNGILVQDARGIFRRMDGKAAAAER